MVGLIITKSGAGVVVLVGTDGRLLMLVADNWPAIREASVLRSLARSRLEPVDRSPFLVIKSKELLPDCCPWPELCWSRYHWGGTS